MISQIKYSPFILLLNLFLFSSAQPYPDDKRNNISLNGEWFLTWNDGIHGKNSFDGFQFSPFLDSSRYLRVPVPMELHLAFQKLGLIGDPFVGLNAMNSRWIEEQYWLYHTSFSVPEEISRKENFLIFERLDVQATVILNGEKIAVSNNSFIPFRINVSGKLKPGPNTLAVAIESGVYFGANKDIYSYDNKGFGSLLTRGSWVRRPAYSNGWDFNGRLLNVGITGDVKIESFDFLSICQTAVLVNTSNDFKNADILVKHFIESAKDCDVRVVCKIRETGQEITQNFIIKKGSNVCSLSLDLINPKLWWPRGHGEQPLYTLESRMYSGNNLLEKNERKFGVRKIEIDRSKHPSEGEYFTMVCNGKKIFCKGADWVPPSMIYSAVDSSKYARLIDLAADANFNFIRVWGGGQYAGNYVLSLCDQSGIMVWHDFLFACMQYPSDAPEFAENVKNELRWGIREFSPHPSLILWCGGNENEYGKYHWGFDKTPKALADFALYHHIMPRIMSEEDPTRPFWPNSPYSSPIVDPNNPSMGDQHTLQLILSTNIWGYRNFTDRFSVEAAMIGASSPKTIRQLLSENQQYLMSFEWQYHDNTANYWLDSLGISYRLIEEWVGKKAKSMSLNEYIFASALLQAESLNEYIRNMRRRMFSSSASVFWMYADTWPVTNGWTIVDYYLRKKLAYHPVRRAYQPVTVVLVNDSLKIDIYGVNDSGSEWKGKLNSGIFFFNGQPQPGKTRNVNIPSNTSKLLASFSKNEWETAGFSLSGFYATLGQGDQIIAQQRMLGLKFKDLQLEKPEIEISRSGNRVTFLSKNYVWGLTLDLDGESNISDDCFDLLPGVPYSIEYPSGMELPKIELTGNQLIINIQQ